MSMCSELTGYSIAGVAWDALLCPISAVRKSNTRQNRPSNALGAKESEFNCTRLHGVVLHLEQQPTGRQPHFQGRRTPRFPGFFPTALSLAPRVQLLSQRLQNKSPSAHLVRSFSILYSKPDKMYCCNQPQRLPKADDAASQCS